MTAAVAVEARGSGPVNVGLAAGAMVAAILLLLGQEQVRRVEAALCASVLSLLHIAPADSMATAVTFPAQGRYVGFSVAPSCTSALLIVPFVVLTGVLLLAGRVQPRQALATAAAFAAVMVVVNEIRLVVIAVSIRAWGFPAGFDRSHVLLGSVVSTIGVAGGLLLFLRMVVPRKEGGRRA